MSSDENDASFSDESSDEDIWEPDSSDSDSDIENLSDFTSPRDRGNAVPKGYNDVDEGPPAPTPKFRPAREPGIHLNDEILTKAGVRKFLHPSDFFKLYFTVDLVNMLVLYTNKYAAHFYQPNQQSTKDGMM
ncbi:piggyBac transposable element-derived protein 3 [Biomphalaria glabrata]|nr:piggyBac transposable element-derived protein 3-like [Biomphalaria glabrata]